MLLIRNLTRAFGGQPVLRGVDLDLVRGEIVCLLGESGSGKTTLLRIVAGLERSDSGSVLLDGKDITTLPVHRRDFGLMFQDFALFPHMNVAQNVRFGLRMRGIQRDKQDTRIHEVLALVGLSGFEQREVAQLSGGEKQRVALARSLAPNPRLLMLDEPLGSLDAALRERLVVELHDIIKEAGLTAIYVTHDQQEAFAIADRIAVMNHGRIEQIDTPQTLYQQPRTVFVAQFLGLHNVIRVNRLDGQYAETPLGTFEVTGTPDALLLHPDGITVTESEGIPGIVESVVFRGDHYRVLLHHASGVTLSFKCSGASPTVGDSLRVQWSRLIELVENKP